MDEEQEQEKAEGRTTPVDLLCDALTGLQGKEGSYVEILRSTWRVRFNDAVYAVSSATRTHLILLVPEDLRDGDEEQISVPKHEVDDVSSTCTARVYDNSAWQHAMLALLREEVRVGSLVDSPWVVHVCKQLILDREASALKYIWNFNVYSSDMQQAALDVCRLLDMVGPAPAAAPKRQSVKLGATPEPEIFTNTGGAVIEGGEVVSMPLRGRPGRNVPEGGLFEKGKSPKGAHLLGRG